MVTRARQGKCNQSCQQHSARAILEAAFNIDVNVLLSQGDKCDLPIFEASKPVEAPKDQRNVAERPFRFVIYWRKTSSSWLRQVPVVIWTSTRDVERIAEAATADFNE